MIEIRTNGAYRQGIIDWLTALGIDTRDVPPDSHASLVDGKLTLEVFYRIDGVRQVDPTTRVGDEEKLARRTVTVDVTVPPTPAAEFWLQPRCGECGR